MSMRLAATLVLACTAPLGAAAAEPPQPWPVAGRQGLVQFVIVPPEHARSAEAYAQQVRVLCEPDRTCFVNFYTNSTGAAVAMPLPEAIEKEATAVYRLSTKRGMGRLQWSCRLQLPEPDCF